jgi:hypothetical protein
MKGYICTSREMAERLKEAGYLPPDNNKRYLSGEWAYYENDPKHPHPGGFFKDDSDICAPTAFELLPEGWTIANLDNGWHVHLYDVGGPTFIHENPHDAAAMAWLWEKEEKQ